MCEQSRQLAAFNALLETLSPAFLKLPESISLLITPKAYGDRNSRESFKGRNGLLFDPVSAAEASAGKTMSVLLHTRRLNRLVSRPINCKDQLTFGIMLQGVFGQTIKKRSGKADTQVKRRVDYVVLNSVMKAMEDKDLAPEARGEILHQVMSLHNWLGKNKRYEHNRIMAKQLDWFLHTGVWNAGFEIKPMPPGSPI